METGADVNLQDNSGNTPLHWSIIKGTQEHTIALLDGGADFDIGDRYEGTPLHFAASYGRQAAILSLLERGADVTARDAFGDTPFDKAAINFDLRGTDAFWALNDARYR